MMLNDDNKKSLKQMLGGRTLYLALGVCLLAAGAVGLTAVKNMTTPKVAVQPPTTEKVTYVNYEKHVFTDPTTQPVRTPVYQTAPVTVPVTEPVTAAVFDSGNTPLSETTAAAESEPETQKKKTSYSSPLTLELGRDYSRGVPVFSPTMKDYRTHNGVDFLGMKGDTVRPIAEGEVLSVTHDPLWGYSVTVDHGDGVVSRICGLSDKDLPEAGAYVHENAVIGRVGAAPVEAEDAPHIHLEVRVNGQLTDPLELMGLSEGDGE